MVMTLPSYYYLVEKYGSENVFWCCDTSLVKFLEIFVPANNIISYDFKKLHGSFFDRVSICISINLLTIKKKWDRIYFFHADLRYKAMYLLSLRKVTDYSLKLAQRQNFIHGRYSGINFFSMVTGIDGPKLEEFNHYFKKVKFVISNLIESNQTKNISALLPKQPYILICPSLSGNAGDQSATLRRLPTQKWQEITSAATEKGYAVVAVGAKDEEEIIGSELNNVINLCGKTSFEDLFTLINSAKYVVATDNGIMHCAYLTNTQTLAIFGPTPSNERIPPNSKVIPIIKSNLNCLPCFDGRLTYPCSSHDCLNKINLQELIDTL